MSASRRHLLFHRQSDWRGAIRGSTNTFAHMALEGGDRVTYMQGLVHAGHLLSGRGQAASYKRGPRREDGAWVFTPFSPIAHARFGPLGGPAFASAAYRTCIPSIRASVRRGGQGEPDAIITARPGSGALKRVYPRAPLLFHVVDYYPAFGLSQMQAVERADYAAADHIVTIGHAVTAHLVEDLGVPEHKITVLGQGVDLQRFAEERDVPEELAALPRPRALWVGWTAKGDPELFEQAAETMAAHGGSLILVGDRSGWAARLAERPHVLHLGVLPPERTAPIMQACDIGLMLYDRSKPAVYRGQHPLKLYEYAAARLAIISTPHKEYEYLDPPLLVASTEATLRDALEEAISRRESLGQSARDFAEQHTWRDCYEKIQSSLRHIG